MNDILEALTKSIENRIKCKGFWLFRRIKKVRSRPMHHPHVGFKIKFQVKNGFAWPYKTWHMSIQEDNIILYMERSNQFIPGGDDVNKYIWKYELSNPSFDPEEFARKIAQNILEFALYDS